VVISGQSCFKAEGLHAARPFRLFPNVSSRLFAFSVWHRVGFMGQIKLSIRMGLATAVKTSTRPRKKESCRAEGGDYRLSAPMGANRSPHAGHSIRSKSTRRSSAGEITFPHFGHVASRDGCTLSRLTRLAPDVAHGRSLQSYTIASVVNLEGELDGKPIQCAPAASC
jgi:hypothetical protein